MQIFTIPVSSNKPYKITTFNVVVGHKTIRFRMEIRHLNYTDKWYISIYDAQSGSPYCIYVPIVASYNSLNNLIELFSYQNIGWMACIPKISEPSSADPKGTNIEEFALLWGDTLG